MTQYRLKLAHKFVHLFFLSKINHCVVYLKIAIWMKSRFRRTTFANIYCLPWFTFLGFLVTCFAYFALFRWPLVTGTWCSLLDTWEVPTCYTGTGLANYMHRIHNVLSYCNQGDNNFTQKIHKGHICVPSDLLVNFMGVENYLTKQAKYQLLIPFVQFSHYFQCGVVGQRDQLLPCVCCTPLSAMV